MSIFFLFHFSSQTNFRKHQLSACMHVQSIFSFCASEVQSAELPSVDSDVVMLLPNTCNRKDCHTNLEFFPHFLYVCYSHVFMHVFACEYAAVFNEAVFVLIKWEGCINTMGNGNI